MAMILFTGIGYFTISYEMLNTCCRFRVKDAVSGQYVVGAPGSLANVYLELRHEEQGARSYSSVSIPASSVKSVYYLYHLSWIYLTSSLKARYCEMDH